MHDVTQATDWQTYASQVIDALSARSMIHHSITRDDLDDMRQAAIVSALEAISNGSRNWRVAGRYGAMRWMRDELRQRGYTIARGRCLPLGSALPKRQSMPDDVSDGSRAADPPSSLEARELAVAVAQRIARLEQPARDVCRAIARGATLASAARGAGVTRHAARAALDQATGRRSPVATRGR